MGALTQDFNIADVVSENLMLMEMETKNKDETLDALISLLYKNKCIDDIADFKKDVIARENEGMTGIGEGVAIPHGKSDSVKITTIAIGTVKDEIEWESLDEKPVKVIILFAVKNTEANTLHIKLLQKVAILLADEEFLEKMRETKTTGQMMHLLSGNAS
jgi:PTS system fructose-specific IIA component